MGGGANVLTPSTATAPRIPPSFHPRSRSAGLFVQYTTGSDSDRTLDVEWRRARTIRAAAAVYGRRDAVFPEQYRGSAVTEHLPPPTKYGWRRDVVVSGVRRMNEVNARRARLVLGWVTVFWRVYHLGM